MENEPYRNLKINTNPLFAIIVPVYNTSSYLNECLISISCQTYKNFHLYLIDDGSTDNSGRILDDFQKRKTDIKIFLYHNKNQGVSKARNFALDKIAQGTTRYDYIYFCDSDDKLDGNLLENVTRRLKGTDADCVFFAKKSFSLKGLIDRKQILNQSFVLENRDMVDLVFKQHRKWRKTACCGWYLWNKIFKASIALNHRFDTSINRGEDFEFCIEILNSINKGILVPDSYYLYRLRKSSLCHFSSLKDDFFIALKLEKELGKYNKYLQIKVNQKILQFIYNYLCELYDCNNFDEISRVLYLYKEMRLNPFYSIKGLKRAIILNLSKKLLYLYLNLHRKSREQTKKEIEKNYFE